MRRIFQHILILFAVFALYCGGHVVKANSFSVSHHEDLYIPFERSALSAEKLITAVKVFYNPVGEQVSVSFKLVQSVQVNVKVMDALGNEVITLMSEELNSGVQNLNFNVQGRLTTGIYFIKVSSLSETIVKRISVR